MINDEHFGGLIWHLECKRLAFEMLPTFIPPADSFQMRMYYSLYITNLISATQLLSDIYGRPFDEAIENALSFEGGADGKNNYGYLRELRNSVVHRAIDITSAGTVAEGVSCAIAPSIIKNKSGNIEYSTFAILLKDVFALCEMAIGPAIHSYIKGDIEALEQRPASHLRENYLKGVDGAWMMPEWAKKMARDAVDSIPFQEAQTDRANKLRSLLLPAKPIRHTDDAA